MKEFELSNLVFWLSICSAFLAVITVVPFYTGISVFGWFILKLFLFSILGVILSVVLGLIALVVSRRKKPAVIGIGISVGAFLLLVVTVLPLSQL